MLLLIGPRRSGKTTVGKLLAERLQQPFRHMRDLAPYAEAMTTEQRHQAWHSGGADALYHYVQPFDADLLERGLAEQARQGDSIVELDAPQSVYDDPALLERARQALQPHHVVLLLPSPDTEASYDLLNRRSFIYLDGGVEASEYFVRHPCNYELAKQIVYTRDQTPQQTCAAVASCIDAKAPEVILIGPIGAGKSTIGHLLAEQLVRPQVPMDQLRWDYYKEIGWSEEEQRRIREAEGFAGVARYWKPFEIHAVERLLQEHHNCVIDFGAGHSVYDDPSHRTRIRDLLAPYPNVVLLLPSPDPDESIAILHRRHEGIINDLPQNLFYISHPSNHALATQTIYTDGKTPNEIADEILLRVP